MVRSSGSSNANNISTKFVPHLAAVGQIKRLQRDMLFYSLSDIPVNSNNAIYSRNTRPLFPYRTNILRVDTLLLVAPGR